MKKKYMLILLVFLLTVGFASVSTTLVMNGTIGVAHKKSDFNVIFKNATVTGNTAAVATISENKRTITFETDKLTTVGDSAELVYKVKNDSTQYDANVSVSCTGGNPGYTNIVSEFAGKSLPLTAPELMGAQEVRMGKVSVNLTKAYDASVTKTPITCTLEIEGEERNSIVERSVCEYADGTVWGFVQKNSEYEFKVPCDGKYKVELWGASGGANASDLSYATGKGAYTSGQINLYEDTPLYVYVGEQGKDNISVSFNGGGAGAASPIYGFSGGGATDVRLVNGNWDKFDGLKSRIMVAGAGSGVPGNIYNIGGQGGFAGGLIGYNGSYYSGHGDLNQYGKGGTQTNGGDVGVNIYSATGYSEKGTFGKGGSAFNTSSGLGTPGAGGGYYGGGAGGGTLSGGNGNGSGGGSSFISGHPGCNAISKDSTTNNIIHTGKPNHYSDYVFTETIMIAGNANMPTYDGKSTMVGNAGNGYAKITLINVG